MLSESYANINQTNKLNAISMAAIIEVALPFQVTYLSHACMELQLGERRLMFDPWLRGPAFARGWWLLHEPPADALDRMCAADLIYISHMHSDHLR